MAVNGESVLGIKDAHDSIVEAFDHLDDLFKENRKKEVVNDSR